jgi:hypothetical protein
LSHADGAHGIRPFGAFTSQKVFQAFPLERAHVLFAAVLVLGAKHRAGTPGRSLWALTLPGIPSDQPGFSRLIRWVLPWVLALPGRGGRKPWPGFPQHSSHALLRAERQTVLQGGAPEFRSASPSSSPRASPEVRTVGKNSPHRVFAPARSRTFESHPVRAMYSPHAAYDITANRPAICGL